MKGFFNLVGWRRLMVVCLGLFVFSRSQGFVRAGDGGMTNAATAAAAPADVVNYTYEVVKTFPHDPEAFTEGLDFLDGHLLESTGIFRDSKSSLREVELATGKVLRRKAIGDQFFGEGLAELNGKLYQLTWKSQKAFVYDRKTFDKLGEFNYTGEGWGLTTDGHWLIMGDGTSVIRFIDPATFKVDHAIDVTLRGAPQPFLNELEWVKGELFANIWQTEQVARIDPATGRIVGMINFSNLLPLADHVPDHTDVLNGIAYDAAGDRLFVTGKNWPKIFEVRLKEVKKK
jgi:glutaminyl-peptide cyclotransferase